ncbi:WD40 repeat domain-containing protein [Chloropicon primus]|uniref:WD40 repeat domain-containing protein n=1 Tax=Chloropicon primus TaxID=1764295 RepID=A0A5B8MH13_9CHLO|nr:WD40 repeat domain-containing protein [Chloropicon primus]UPQ98909.1 WD40 repeat domain-containing protein [Chloropicon primus]|eukprot:QDZ19697.1 WD40 repeat domain-containing protein [Chloropicon primus]
MRDPVMCTGDGHTYERHAIAHWLEMNKTSPLTGSSMERWDLVPNHAVRKAIAELQLELPSEEELQSSFGVPGDDGGQGASSSSVVQGGPAEKRVYNEDGIYVFASLRRSLYSLDATVHVWKAKKLCMPSKVATSAVESTWESSMKAQVTCMKALDRGRVVVSGSRDKMLRVWNVPKGGVDSAHLKQEAALQGHTDWVNCLDVDGREEVVVTGGRDTKVIVWDTLKWYAKHTMKTQDYVNCVAFDRVRDKFFVSGGNDWKVLLWDSQTFRQSLEFSGHTYALKCCAVDPVSASWVVTSGDDSKLCVWSPESNKCLVEIEGAGGDYNESINCCSISSDGHVVACGLANKRIALWDTRTWKLLQKLDGHKSGVEDLCFVPGFSNKKLISVDGRSLRSWSCKSSDWSCDHTVTAHAIACCEMASY